MQSQLWRTPQHILQLAFSQMLAYLKGQYDNVRQEIVLRTFTVIYTYDTARLCQYMQALTEDSLGSQELLQLMI